MEKFKMTIDAESHDGETVKCETKVEIACTKELAISILANLMRREPSLKDMFMHAIVASMSPDKDTEEISEDEYNTTKEEGDENTNSTSDTLEDTTQQPEL